MLGRLTHRGKEHTKTIDRHNVTMLASWSEIEARPVPSDLRANAVWDGVSVPKPTPEGLADWSNSFALAAVSSGSLLLARDALGVRPLYYGNIDGCLAFASEVKALLTVTEDVNEFPPGTWYTPQDGFQRFARVTTGKLPYDDVDRTITVLRQKIENAIARRIVADEMGTWLSGGVDSSVIATLARQQVRALHSFVSGVEGAPDITYGNQMAEFLGTKHHVLTLTLDDLLSALPEVIYHLESFDAWLVRSSVASYLTSKMVADYVERTGFEGVPPLPKEVSSTIANAKKLPKVVQF
jgi:asparagine synthase (glutamine-hydrolysing)